MFLDTLTPVVWLIIILQPQKPEIINTITSSDISFNPDAQTDVTTSVANDILQNGKASSFERGLAMLG
jgi:hypothetical protein